MSRPALFALLFAFPSVFAVAAEPSFVLEADAKHAWYRGNMHTHSLWSDGDDYLESIAKWYREHEYQFLVFTDHNVLADRERWIDVDKSKGKRVAYDKLKANFPGDWVEEQTTDDGRLEVKLKTFEQVAKRFDVKGEFLLIQGEEITDRYQNLPIHMNATNTPELLPPLHGESVRDVMQRNVDRALAVRERTGEPILVHLNHPNFGYGVTAEDLMVVRGENFFEVYNGHPGVRNSGDPRHASTEVMWDAINTRRLADLELPLMYGLATDDGHSYHRIPSRASEPGRGWVVVLSDRLTPRGLVEAIEAGRYYASSGVALKRITVSPKSMTVEVDGEEGVEYVVEFLGTRKGFDPTTEEVQNAEGEPLRATLRYSKDVGEVLARVEGTTATYEFTGDELFVRARVISTRKHPNPSEIGEFERAWVQPVRGPGAR